VTILKNDIKWIRNAILMILTIKSGTPIFKLMVSGINHDSMIFFHLTYSVIQHAISFQLEKICKIVGIFFIRRFS